MHLDTVSSKRIVIQINDSTKIYLAGVSKDIMSPEVHNLYGCVISQAGSNTELPIPDEGSTAYRVAEDTDVLIKTIHRDDFDSHIVNIVVLEMDVVGCFYTDKCGNWHVKKFEE
jgi:hypothetical protein